MKTNLNTISKLLLASGLLAAVSCQKASEKNELTSAATTDNIAADEFAAAGYSVTPAFIKKLPGFGAVKVGTLISSDDKLEYSPNFIFGGSADGSGLLRLPE